MDYYLVVSVIISIITFLITAISLWLRFRSEANSFKKIVSYFVENKISTGIDKYSKTADDNVKKRFSLLIDQYSTKFINDIVEKKTLTKTDKYSKGVDENIKGLFSIIIDHYSTNFIIDIIDLTYSSRIYTFSKIFNYVKHKIEMIKIKESLSIERELYPYYFDFLNNQTVSEVDISPKNKIYIFNEIIKDNFSLAVDKISLEYEKNNFEVAVKIENISLKGKSTNTISIKDSKIGLSNEINKKSSQKYHTVSILYGTDRERSNIIKPNIYYGGKRGDFEYGICDVSIPFDHVEGKIERPEWWKLRFEENPINHVSLLSIQVLSKNEFINKTKNKVDKLSIKDSFVFIHGFNVSFAEAARRTAQIAFDLSFEGAPILYSWPSKGTLEGYLGDEDDVRFTVPNLIEFLKLIYTECGIERIHLIAHSMGNRALVDSLVQLVSWAQERGFSTLFKNVILTAPDIDANLFKTQIAPAMLDSASRTTLYSSSKDRALALSRSIRTKNYPRLGESGDMLEIINGMDTIDASEVDTDFLGHSFFPKETPLINDIYYLTKHNLTPQDRRLVEKYKDSKRYWAFRKST